MFKRGKSTEHSCARHQRVDHKVGPHLDLMEEGNKDPKQTGPKVNDFGSEFNSQGHQGRHRRERIETRAQYTWTRSDRVGFEPTVLAYTSFQDWHLQPLRHPSSAREWDLNPQCSDYEPDELPITPSRKHECGRTRTCNQ
eukprot:29642-Pelagococcus_subviridis.AAC.7